MKEWILRIGFAVAMILAGYVLGIYTSGTSTRGHRSIAVVHAQATTQVNMPKAWGPLIGMTTGVLVFQDRAGVIRLVAADTGAVGELITRN
jgi:hypothetical protein